MKLLTIQEAAEVLNVHPNTIRALLTKLGAVDLNCGKRGRRLIRIPEKNIENYLRECVIHPPIPIRHTTRPTARLERRRA